MDVTTQQSEYAALLRRLSVAQNACVGEGRDFYSTKWVREDRHLAVLDAQREVEDYEQFVEANGGWLYDAAV